MTILITAVISLAVLAVASYRIVVDGAATRTRGPLAGLSNPVTQLLLCLGFAKLCRVPVITDDIINPRLRDFTGVANIMSLVGMTWAALIAIPLMGIAAYITGGVQFSARLQMLQAGLIVGVMTIAFLYSPMADQPTSYMTSDFPVTGSVLLYWLAFLLPILTSCGVTAYHCAVSLFLVRRGLLARALGALFCAAAVGILYCSHKGVDLFLQYSGIDNAYSHNAKAISLVLVLAALAFAALAAGIYAGAPLPQRLQRYRLLRKYGRDWLTARANTPVVVLDRSHELKYTRWACWAAARTPTAAFHLQVELADASDLAPKQPVTAIATQ
ncbi:hypothetical protein ACH47B_26970 [Rhodococcus sp. NPDC019627]|uniref:hypothetical protein n=1 Tax=unclassified Rhodococcus (in: high G+C Gram-positive bacteria) TaxID=192944 RepID=UPI0033F8ADC9